MICQNCSCFIQDVKDLSSGLGICMMEDTFEPFEDEILADADFSNCYDLYLKKRYHGGKEVCEFYLESETDEFTEDNDFDVDSYNEQMKNKNVDDIIRDFYDDDSDIVNEAISAISAYVKFGNENAYKALMGFYRGLGPALSLEDVHNRVEIVDTLYKTEPTDDIIDTFVNELMRTPSNNTTRQLYTRILELLSRYPVEMVEGPLSELLRKRNYSYRIKNKIIATILRDSDEYWNLKRGPF